MQAGDIFPPHSQVMLSMVGTRVFTVLPGELCPKWQQTITSQITALLASLPRRYPWPSAPGYLGTSRYLRVPFSGYLQVPSVPLGFPGILHRGLLGTFAITWVLSSPCQLFCCLPLHDISERTVFLQRAAKQHNSPSIISPNLLENFLSPTHFS